jgi:glycosyltransferase involved in cell wall biosynthesis
VLQQNTGIADAYNTGIAAAQGELVAFLSHDDIWMPNKLSLQVNYMRAHPDIEYTITFIKYFLEPGSQIPRAFKSQLLE